MKDFRFGIVSDPHIGLPETIWDSPKRFHLVEVSIPALEQVLAHFAQLDLDFLLLPGDLTQHGEKANHFWLANRLASLPFPCYVSPGNHDVPYLEATEKAIAFNDFSTYYEKFGYENTQQLYYTQEILPGVQLISLNSNQFDAEGNQLGCLDDRQFLWLEETLARVQDKFILLMVHHNVIEHLPGQSEHELGKRYMLDDKYRLLKLLRKYNVKLVFTGHLHVQDVAEIEGIYEITTGSLVSYPHPYRVVEITKEGNQLKSININSYRVEGVPGWEHLPTISRKWMGDRSYPFMMRLLTSPPLNLSNSVAAKLAPKMANFWADIAQGDTIFEFPDFPTKVRKHLLKFGAIDQQGNPRQIDNFLSLNF